MVTATEAAKFYESISRQRVYKTAAGFLLRLGLDKPGGRRNHDRNTLVHKISGLQEYLKELQPDDLTFNEFSVANVPLFDELICSLYDAHAYLQVRATEQLEELKRTIAAPSLE